MSYRRHSLVGRTIEELRAAARTAIERLRGLRGLRAAGRSTTEPIDGRRSDDRSDGRRPADRTAGLRAADRERPTGDGIALESGGDAVDRSRVAAPTLVDPDDGPTSRSEILEYGVSPVQYVRAVVADRGGRMKQRRFADEYGWSPSTVSRLLSDLEERGAIRRYRIGQEKVVCVPDDESWSGSDSSPESSDPVESRSRTDASARPAH